jgi:hypothetical protein
MAIRELGDLPYEVWMEVLSSSASNKFIPWAQTFGSYEYTISMQKQAVTCAMEKENVCKGNLCIFSMGLLFLIYSLREVSLSLLKTNECFFLHHFK